MSKELDELKRLTHLDVPADFQKLDARSRRAVLAYVEQVVEQERAGMDRLFESISHTMKYIPNFLLQAITQKYIDPPIAAKITVKLKLKDAIGIANGLPAEYVAESARYLESEYAAQFLGGLNNKLQKAVVDVLARRYPIVMLDIYQYVDAKTQRSLRFPQGINVPDAALTPSRTATLKKLMG